LFAERLARVSIALRTAKSHIRPFSCFDASRFRLLFPDWRPQEIECLTET